MDAELAALIEEQKRQAEMLKSLGLLDEEEEAEQPAAEAAELHQEQEAEALHQEQQQEEAIEAHQEQAEEVSPAAPVAAAPAPVAAVPAAALPPRLELCVFSVSASDEYHHQPATLRAASGRVFLDYGKQAFATGDLAELDDPAGMAADLLDIAKAKGWYGYTIKGAKRYAEVFRAAFRVAVAEGLRLLPDPVCGQGSLVVGVLHEFKEQGPEGLRIARAFAHQCANNEAFDERREASRALIKKLKAAHAG